MYRQQQISVSHVVRAVFGTATLGFLALGFILDSGQLFAISGVCGIIWWIWDLLVDYVFVPGGDWLVRMLTGQEGEPAQAGLRPSLEETVGFLESYIEHGASRRVELNSAIRLEEIYRTVKKDSHAAGRVILRMREKYPNAPELKQYDAEGVYEGHRDRSNDGVG